MAPLSFKLSLNNVEMSKYSLILTSLNNLCPVPHTLSSKALVLAAWSLTCSASCCSACYGVLISNADNKNISLQLILFHYYPK